MDKLKDRMLSVLAIIVFAAIFISVAIHAFTNNIVNNPTPIATNNSTQDRRIQENVVNMTNANAVQTALNDSKVQSYLVNHTYSIESASSFDNYYNQTGYVNGPDDDYQDVAIRVIGTRGYFDEVELLTTVDMTEKR